MTIRSPIQVELEFAVHSQHANITWQAPTFGRRVSVFRLPYDHLTLPLVIKALDARQYPGHPSQGPQFSDQEQNRLKKQRLWQDGAVATDAYRRVGAAIYEGFGAQGKSTIEDLRNDAINQRRSINYVLRFPKEGVHLAALPWELLWDQGSLCC